MQFILVAISLLISAAYVWALPADWSRQVQEISQSAQESIENARSKERNYEQEARALLSEGEKGPVEKNLEKWGFHEAASGRTYEIVFPIPNAKYFKRGKLAATFPYRDHDALPEGASRFSRLDQHPVFLRLILEWELRNENVDVVELPVNFAGQGPYPSPAMEWWRNDVPDYDGYHDAVRLLTHLLQFVTDDKLDPSKILEYRPIYLRLTDAENKIERVKKEWSDVIARLEKKGFKREDSESPFTTLDKGNGYERIRAWVVLLSNNWNDFGSIVLHMPGSGTGTQLPFSSIKDFNRFLDAWGGPESLPKGHDGTIYEPSSK